MSVAQLTNVSKEQLQNALAQKKSGGGLESEEVVGDLPSGDLNSEGGDRSDADSCGDADMRSDTHDETGGVDGVPGPAADLCGLTEIGSDTDIEHEGVVGVPASDDVNVEAAGRPETDQCDDGVHVRFSATVRQWDSYLLRGSREPLASMGMYQYAMYVYSRKASHSKEDFATYFYADPHPHVRSQVQKLRVDECFRVPRLFGMTLSPQVKDPERNALLKLVLFMPLAYPTSLSEIDDDAKRQIIVRLLADSVGCKFACVWQAWYDVQRALSDKYLLRQEAACVCSRGHISWRRKR